MFIFHQLEPGTLRVMGLTQGGSLVVLNRLLKFLLPHNTTVLLGRSDV